MPQKTFLFGYQKQAPIYDNEGPPSKTRHTEDDLILILKNSRVNDTYTVKVVIY